jgi:VirB8 protein
MDRSEDAMRERADAVRKQHAASVRSRRRTDTAKNVALVGVAVGWAWAAYNNNRLAEKVVGREVVYAVLQPNGEFIASDHYAEPVPRETQQDNINSAGWTYVQARDCFGSSSLIRQYYIAQTMSDDHVANQARAQFSLDNPEAPQHVYGDHGITVQCEMIDPPTPIGDAANNQLLFRFRRWEETAKTTYADKASAPFYTVTMHYRLGVYPPDPRRKWLDRNTINPPGMQVVDYPGAKPENAVPVKTRKQQVMN